MKDVGFHNESPFAVQQLVLIDENGRNLVVVVIKMSAVSDISIEPGLYVFIAAVVASMLVVRRISRLAKP